MDHARTSASELPPANRRQLLRIYRLYDEWAGEFAFACSEGCATCCTRSVSMTTLEGELILDFIQAERPHLLPLVQTTPRSSFVPATTTNRFAASCLRGEEIDETQEWDFTPCIFLQQNRCTIYPARSFMCRSFGSKVRCDRSGAAEVEPLFLTLNTIVMQCIEHLDRGRPWGNMNTVLGCLTAGEPDLALAAAKQIPGWLIPPDEIPLVRDRLETLLAIIRES